MNENIWSIEDVMDYFGELFNQDEETQKKVRVAMILNMDAIDADGKSHNLFAKMHSMRERLIKAGKDVPFRASYRRVKK